MPIKRSDFSDYYIPNLPGYETISNEESVKFFTLPFLKPKPGLEAQPVHGSVEGVKRLKEQGYQTHIITARGEPVREATMQWIEKYFPGLINGITFCNHHRSDYPELSKEEVALKLGIKIMIDDNYFYAKDLVKKGIQVFLIDRPRNQQFDPKVDLGITKVKSWEEISMS